MNRAILRVASRYMRAAVRGGAKLRDLLELKGKDATGFNYLQERLLASPQSMPVELIRRSLSNIAFFLNVARPSNF